jgi:asparaginyl-tRNA synthetase
MKQIDPKKKIAYLEVMSGVLGHSSKFFHDRGFTELRPVILSSITDPLGPDPNSSVVKTGKIDYLDQELCITQSMILHKQLAVKMGIDKLVINSPNIRLEHPKRLTSGKHCFEFAQMDFEIAHAKMDDVFQLMEAFLASAVHYVRTVYASQLELCGRQLAPIQGRFPQYTTHELEAEYGPDWEYEASMAHKTPFWALCHKREFYDKSDPKEPGHFLNYDLIYPDGYGEALSGAEREHDFAIIMGKIEAHQREDPSLNIARYAQYLERAKDGLVPSAGGGYGLERLTRFLTGAEHVGDVQLFPRVPGVKVDV